MALIEYITDQGKEMLARMLAGDVKITFTRIQMGDGTLGTGQSRRTMTQLVNPVKELEVNRVNVTDENVVSIMGIFENSDMTSGFFFREKGIFASDETDEILFAYANAGDSAEYIDPPTVESVEKQIISLYTGLQDTEKQINITIQSGVYALQEDAETLQGNMNELQEVQESHINDKNNPHGVTKSQVGLGNVDNTADADKNVNYATNAGSAVKAEQDENGNNIINTYANKVEVNSAYNQANSAYNQANSAMTKIDASNLALGNNANASGNCSTALGYNTTASGNYSTALGYNTTASGNYSTALGHNTTASGGRSTALGYWSNASGVGSTALGHYSNAIGDYSVALGYNTKANGYSSATLGCYANANGNYSTALGYRANVSSASTNTIQLGSASDLSALSCRVALTVTSDERDKADITEIEDGAVEFLKKIHAIRYVFNHRELYIDEDSLSDEEKEKKEKYGLCVYDKEEHAKGTKKGNRIRVGVSAQETMKALQEVYGDSSYANLINDNLFDLDTDEIPDGVENQLSANYEGFIPFLIKAVQELSGRLEALEEKEGEQ